MNCHSFLHLLCVFLALSIQVVSAPPLNSSYYPNASRNLPRIDIRNFESCKSPAGNRYSEKEAAYSRIVDNWEDMRFKPEYARPSTGFEVYAILNVGALKRMGLLDKIRGAGFVALTEEEIRAVIRCFMYIGSGTPDRKLHHLYAAATAFNGHMDLNSIRPHVLAMAGLAEDFGHETAIVVLARTFSKRAAEKIENTLVRAFKGLTHNKATVIAQGELDSDRLLVANFLIERFVCNIGSHLVESQFFDVSKIAAIPAYRAMKATRTPRTRIWPIKNQATIYEYKEGESPILVCPGDPTALEYLKLTTFVPTKFANYNIKKREGWNRVIDLFVDPVKEIFAHFEQLDALTNAKFDAVLPGLRGYKLGDGKLLSTLIATLYVHTFSCYVCLTGGLNETSAEFVIPRLAFAAAQYRFESSINALLYIDNPQAERPWGEAEPDSNRTILFDDLPKDFVKEKLPALEDFENFDDFAGDE